MLILHSFKSSNPVFASVYLRFFFLIIICKQWKRKDRLQKDTQREETETWQAEKQMSLI